MPSRNLAPTPIKKFQIFAGADTTELEQIVNLKIDNNWQPLGQPFVVGSIICLAMVKYESA